MRFFCPILPISLTYPTSSLLKTRAVTYHSVTSPKNSIGTRLSKFYFLFLPPGKNAFGVFGFNGFSTTFNNVIHHSKS